MAAERGQTKEWDDCLPHMFFLASSHTIDTKSEKSNKHRQPEVAVNYFCLFFLSVYDLFIITNYYLFMNINYF